MSSLPRTIRYGGVAVVICALIVLSGGRASAASSNVQMRDIASTGPTHTFEVILTDGNGKAIPQADLDLGGLGADPDLRVPTTPLREVGGSSAYRASVSFPADGAWVMVVRVHTPVSRVELFTVTVEGTGTAANTHVVTPSRRAVSAQDPTFFAHSSAAAPHANSAHVDAGAAPFDPVGLGFLIAHSFGAAAWILAILVLSLAGRVDHGPARRAIVEWVSDRYHLLAGGGLFVVVITGVENVQRSSPGLLDPAALVRSRLGTAYLGLFVFKMFVAAMSVATTWRIGRLLPTSMVVARRQARLASVGAMANDDPPAGADLRRVFRLVDLNVALGGAIITAVAVLGQLHHALL